MASQNESSRSFMSRLPFASGRTKEEKSGGRESSDEDTRTASKAPKWSFGVLNDKETVEVPGSVLLLSDHKNEPLGLRNAPARTSHSSIPTGTPRLDRAPPKVIEEDEKKKTGDGKIILEPQPEDSANDPLNWPTWRRDAALLSLGLYCMLGGGMTPVLAAGFSNVAGDYDVPLARVSLSTGLFMMGMGMGSVFASPTAILWGKRPVYLVSAVLFIGTSAWCAASPSFNSLLAARVFQGMAISPVECLPSATIAEIYFLHERAFRIGIYTLLLLGGKNLTPLISAAIIQSLSWRWVFWIVAFIAAFCGVLLFLFVPETFWDRSPIPRSRAPSRPSMFRRISSVVWSGHQKPQDAANPEKLVTSTAPSVRSYHDRPHDANLAKHATPPEPRHVASEDFSVQDKHSGPNDADAEKHATSPKPQKDVHFAAASSEPQGIDTQDTSGSANQVMFISETVTDKDHALEASEKKSPDEHSPKTLASPGGDSQPLQVPSPHHLGRAHSEVSPLTPAPATVPLTTHKESQSATPAHSRTPSLRSLRFSRNPRETDEEKAAAQARRNAYTGHWREREAKSFTQQLRPWHGRLNHDKWLKVAVRPFILFTYPSVLWSSLVYACSVGWLIVVSESVTVIYREDYYHFDALQTGLMYISPFVGGVLGTAVAGKVSDVIVKAMARRNGGLYEPEFRLVMAAPVAVTTVIGLMGYGWAAEERDAWIVPTVFLGVVSFGCSLGSTTSITFCVDSYRQYAGEALVTLNFSKNIFHGLVFSFFVTGWIESDGAKSVFVWIGVIQLVVLVFTIPMFIYGKRARMMTIRRNWMEKF